ncbi:unnamed protein product [Clavelina lepadiformis]|uniref:Uncharacterized protein n=1 Tax=Clavelina lepadiformis TaxID=159417 RepID=A0ABP0F0M9_CLALP
MQELVPKCFSKRLKLFLYRTNQRSLPFSQINALRHEVTRALLTWSKSGEGEGGDCRNGESGRVRSIKSFGCFGLFTFKPSQILARATSPFSLLSCLRRVEVGGRNFYPWTSSLLRVVVANLTRCALSGRRSGCED